MEKIRLDSTRQHLAPGWLPAHSLIQADVTYSRSGTESLVNTLFSIPPLELLPVISLSVITTVSGTVLPTQSSYEILLRE